MTELTGKGLSKRFLRRRVLHELNVHAVGGDVLGIVGANGSGKSTLAKILGGVLRPDGGTVHLTINGAVVAAEERPLNVGMVAPYLNVYDEFSPVELLELQRRLHGGPAPSNTIEQTLTDVGLIERQHDAVRTLSSGLRQRAILALAIHRRPALLILDEPTITLDDAGVEIVTAQIRAQSNRGGITLLATNDAVERSWCTATINVG